MDFIEFILLLLCVFDRSDCLFHLHFIGFNEGANVHLLESDALLLTTVSPPSTAISYKNAILFFYDRKCCRLSVLLFIDMTSVNRMYSNEKKNMDFVHSAATRVLIRLFNDIFYFIFALRYATLLYIFAFIVCRRSFEINYKFVCDRSSAGLIRKIYFSFLKRICIGQVCAICASFFFANDFECVYFGLLKTSPTEFLNRRLQS